MKKQITTIFTSAFILITVTACERSVPENRQEDRSAVIESNVSVHSVVDNDLSGGSVSEVTQADDSIEDSSDDPKFPVTATCRGEECAYVEARGIYGETDIPDIPCDNVDAQGSVCPTQITPIGIENMVFEEHTFGDCTVRLVGRYVRTDEENFPGVIYARYLFVEVENQKSGFSDTVSYIPLILGQSVFKPEYRIFPDRIGDYVDMYDMEYPIIAMNYFPDDAPEYVSGDITQTVSFAMMLPDREEIRLLLGSYETGLGIVINDGSIDDASIITNRGPTSGWPSALCGSTELTAADERTLLDEALGIRYSFDFTDFAPFGDISSERLTVERA